MVMSADIFSIAKILTGDNTYTLLKCHGNNVDSIFLWFILWFSNSDSLASVSADRGAAAFICLNPSRKRVFGTK